MLDAKLAAPNPDFLSYTLSKYALAGLTELARGRWPGRASGSTAIAPALMLPSGAQSEANFAAAHALNPLGRGVEVDDVVAALRFLIAQPAMTGETLLIDGGQRFLALPRDVQFLEHEMTHDDAASTAWCPTALKVRRARSCSTARGHGRHRLSRFRDRHAAAAAGHGRSLARRAIAAPADDDPARRGIMICCAARSRRSPAARRYQSPGNAGPCDLRASRRAPRRAPRCASTSIKPDVYPDARGVGVEIASFAGPCPRGDRYRVRKSMAKRNKIRCAAILAFIKEARLSPMIC